MRKYHIPFDLILQDGEDDLHEKVNKNIKFSKYKNELNLLIDKIIMDEKLKCGISEACQSVYIFAEIVAYKEGFEEGIRFLTNILTGTDESEKSCKKY